MEPLTAELRTDRLGLAPLQPADVPEMVDVLADPELYRVAAAIGLLPTEELDSDGEVVWRSPPT